MGIYTTYSLKGQTYQFSIAQENQTEKLFSLVNEGYRREETRKENVNRFDSIEDVARIINDTDKVFWIVLQQPLNDNTTALIGSLQISKDKDKHSLGAFAIDPQYKHLKLGKVMLEEAEKYLTEKKVDSVFLDVISVAKKPLNSTEEWAHSEAEIEVEEDRLADFYKANGFVFTGSKTIPALQWQESTRKPEYRDKVFFREMKKVIENPPASSPKPEPNVLYTNEDGTSYFFETDGTKVTYGIEKRTGISARIQDGFSST